MKIYDGGYCIESASKSSTIRFCLSVSGTATGGGSSGSSNPLDTYRKAFLEEMAQVSIMQSVLAELERKPPEGPGEDICGGGGTANGSSGKSSVSPLPPKVHHHGSSRHHHHHDGVVA